MDKDFLRLIMTMIEVLTVHLVIVVDGGTITALTSTQIINHHE